MKTQNDSIVEITPASILTENVKQSKCRDISTEFDRLISRLLLTMTDISQNGETTISVAFTETDYTVMFIDDDKPRRLIWNYAYLTKLRDDELKRILVKVYEGFSAAGYMIGENTVDNVVILKISWDNGDVSTELPAEPWYRKLFK